MALIKEDQLFGRIALLNNFITKPQLEEVLNLQAERSRFCPLAILLLEKGYINRGQFRDIIETQKKRMPKPAINPQERREDLIFGYLGFKNHYLDEESIYRSLCLQSQLAKKGLLFRLSELLVNKGYLTVSQAEKIVDEQDRLVITCSACELQYHILGLQTSSFACKKCGSRVDVDPDILERYQLAEIESFNANLQTLSQNQVLEAKPKPKKELRPTDALQILSDGCTEFHDNIAYTRDEDMPREEEADVTYGVSETSEEEEIEELLEEDFIAAGISGPERLKKHKDEEEWYKVGLSLGEGTSSEDGIFEDIREEEMIEISGIALARKTAR